jgi:hypothetical protein
VLPLALPPGERPPDTLAGVDAVTLFCERARAHDPGFQLSASTAAGGRGDLPPPRPTAAGDRVGRRPLRPAVASPRSASTLASSSRRSPQGSGRERHYRFFLALARRHATAKRCSGPTTASNLRRLSQEHETFHAALGWALQRDTGGPALEMSAALGEYWMSRKRMDAAVPRIDRALGAPELRVRVRCTKAWAWAFGRQGDHASCHGRGPGDSQDAGRPCRPREGAVRACRAGELRGSARCRLGAGGRGAPVSQGGRRSVTATV